MRYVGSAMTAATISFNNYSAIRIASTLQKCINMVCKFNFDIISNLPLTKHKIAEIKIVYFVFMMEM